MQQTPVTTYLCCVENVDYLAEDGVVFALVFLANQLDVPKFAEVEVSLLLQSVYSQLQLHQLRKETEECDSESVCIMDLLRTLRWKRSLNVTVLKQVL